jgi:hypothetical protein
MGSRKLTDGLTYDVPVSLIEAYRGRKIIVRSPDPSEITRRISGAVPEGLAYIRILSLDGAMDDLKNWLPGLPIDLVVRDTREDLPRLYRYAPLLSAHPLRVSVPLAPGFGAVVKLAASLNFAVKVEGGQPDQTLAEELLQIAHTYLHRTTVSEPIEFFHSLFRAFYHRDPVTLWAIQEEDPALFRFVTDRGKERMPGRLAGEETLHGFPSFTREGRDRFVTEMGDCAGCEFLTNCSGYFKWPRREYSCDGIQSVMHTLREAAEGLRRDVASSQVMEGKPS